MPIRSLSPPRMVVTLALAMLVSPQQVEAKTLVVVGPAASGRGAQRVARAAHARLIRAAKRLHLRVVALHGRKAAKARRCLRRAACSKQLARRLRADALLSSTVWRRGKRLRLALRLVDGKSGRNLASEQLKTKSPRGVPARAVGLAVGMLGQLQPKPAPDAIAAPEPAPIVAGTTTNVSAEMALLQQADEETPPP